MNIADARKKPAPTMNLGRCVNCNDTGLRTINVPEFGPNYIIEFPVLDYCSCEIGQALRAYDFQRLKELRNK